jgi:hypothetical protein
MRIRLDVLMDLSSLFLWVLCVTKDPWRLQSE